MNNMWIFFNLNKKLSKIQNKITQNKIIIQQQNVEPWKGKNYNIENDFAFLIWSFGKMKNQ
jgi:hypothetical protein